MLSFNFEMIPHLSDKLQESSLDLFLNSCESAATAVTHLSRQTRKQINQGPVIYICCTSDAAKASRTRWLVVALI